MISPPESPVNGFLAVRFVTHTTKPLARAATFKVFAGARLFRASPSLHAYVDFVETLPDEIILFAMRAKILFLVRNVGFAVLAVHAYAPF